MSGVETVLARSLLWTMVGAAAAIPTLVVPQPADPLLTVVIQLSLVVVFAISLAFHLAPFVDEPWFAGFEVGRRARMALTWAVVVFAVTGAAGATMLATSAALRYDPSLQFLQLVAGSGMAGCAAAVVLGSRHRIGSRTALGGAVVVLIVGVGSLWRYLDAVGFTAAGGWIVDASKLARLVLPYDAAVVIAALVAFSAGVNMEPEAGE